MNIVCKKTMVDTQGSTIFSEGKSYPAKEMIAKGNQTIVTKDERKCIRTFYLDKFFKEHFYVIKENEE